MLTMTFNNEAETDQAYAFELRLDFVTIKGCFWGGS